MKMEARSAFVLRRLVISAANAVLLLFFCLFWSCSQRADEHAYDRVFRTADSLYKLNAKDISVRMLDSFFRTQKNIPAKRLFDKYHFLKSYHYYNADYVSSERYVDSMLYAIGRYPKKDESYYLDYTQALNEKGDIYFSQNNLNKAFEYYYKSRLAAMNSGDTCALGNHSYHLGMVTYRQQKYRNAIVYFNQSFVENSFCGNDSINFFRSQELLNNVALCYTRLKVMDSAMLYYDKALDYIRENGDRYGDYTHHFIQRARGVIYGNQAKIFAALGKTDTAEALLKTSIAINRQPGNDSLDAQFAQMQLAELYFDERKSPLPLLESLRTSLDSLSNKDVELRWTRLMYRFLQRADRPEEALSYMDRYLRLSDSFNASNAYRQTDVSKLLQYQETQSQVSLLRKDNELRRLYLWGAIGFSVMPFVIVVLIYVNYRRSKRNIRILTDLNGRINEQNTTLESALTALEFSNKDKDRIMRVVAHDLRGPISGVAVLADRLLHKEEMEEGERKSLSLIRDTSYSSMSLINELLEHNSPADEEREAADIGDLVRESVQVLSGRAAEKGQELRVNKGEALSVYVNKGRIARVLTNIITNAIKFSPERGLIRIGISREGALAVVAVRDEGIGIPEDLKTHVFGTVSRAKRRGTAGEQSYGLGLSISRQIVEQNKGKLWFESEEGKGSTFYIALPLSGQDV